LDIINNKYILLNVDVVKSGVKEIPEEALQQYLATVPQFYEDQSAYFPDLGKSIKACLRKSWRTE
jgi:hypothetical protein